MRGCPSFPSPFPLPYPDDVFTPGLPNALSCEPGGYQRRLRFAPEDVTLRERERVRDRERGDAPPAPGTTRGQSLL